MESSKLNDNNIWDIIYSYFKYHKYYLTNHHLDSFNDFITNKIPQTFKENNPQTIFLERNPETKNYKYELEIYYGGIDGDKINIGKPIIYHKDNVKKQMFPNEARLKNIDYSTHLFCDIEVKIKNNEDGNEDTLNFNHISLGSIPIMLHSKLCVLQNQTFDNLKNMGECPYEQGGYFIVEGKEKVIVSHERKAENKLYVQEINDDYYSHTVNIKSVPEGKFKYPKTTEICVRRSDNTMLVRLPGFSRRVPLFIIFRFLGVISDKEILHYIFEDLNDEVHVNMLNDIIETVKDGSILYSQRAAADYLKKFTQTKTISEVFKVIINELVPHVGEDFNNKAYFIGHMVKKLIYKMHNLVRNTDRDSYAFKRVDLSGFLLAGLFRDNFLQFQRNAKIEIDQEFRFNSSKYKSDISTIINDANLRNVFNSKKIEKEYMRAFKIGTILNKKGLIQALTRRSFSDIISHTRRINTPTGNVMIGQRRLHSTQYGIICPIEAPDGGNVGIKKHMTVMTHITFGCNSEPIKKCLREHGLIYLNEIRPIEISRNNYGKVMVNGNYIGVHQNISLLVRTLKLFRRNGLINIFTSIYWDTRFNELFLSTDGGRCTRPLLIVKNNDILIKKNQVMMLKEGKITWKNLVFGTMNQADKMEFLNCDYSCPKEKKKLLEKLETTQGVIEYLDVDELDNLLISASVNDLYNSDNSKPYTHCEIHPSMILGPLGFICPFSNNSQSIRPIFGAGQGKQAVGIYTSNFRNRMDNASHVLNYPQKPIITNRLNDYIFNSKLPCGINAVVAIGSYSGYNQEDSVIINRGSLHKGLFNTSYYKIYEGLEMYDKKNNIGDNFYSPEFDEKNVKLHKDYNYNKLDKFGVVKENTYVYQNDVIIGKYKDSIDGNNDSSIAVKKDSGGLVDKVYIFNTNSDNHKLCKVRLCKTRIPELGDKFASRHGQKGTVGIIMDEKDMPYSKEGIVPDIIVNPHAFPSRMTIGQFLETLAGKICCDLGFSFDGTPFEDQSIEDLGNILESKCGYEKYGTEILYSGISGKKLNTEIFMGPTYYQRLKQMVQDKINSRAPGKINYLTKQPPAGRAAGGGLRLGEMERDAIISHGISQFLKESTMEKSDKHSCYVCDHSGEIVGVNPEKNIFVSPSVDGPIEFEGNKIEELKPKVRENKSHSFSKIEIPYSVKLLTQECGAMGINLRLITKNSLLKSQNSILNDIDNLNEKKPINERILIIGDKVTIHKSDRKLKRFKNFKDIIGKEGLIINEIRKGIFMVEVDGKEYKISKYDLKN